MSAGTVTGSWVISSPTVRSVLVSICSPSFRRGDRRQLVARRRDQRRDRRGHVDHPVVGVGDQRQVGVDHAAAALAEEALRARAGPPPAARRGRCPPARRTASGAGTRRRGRSPACAGRGPAAGRACGRGPRCRGRPAGCRRSSIDRRASDRDRRPDRRRVRQRRLDEDRAAVGQAPERIALAERRHVVERHEVDVLELPVLADPLRGQGQVVGRRQALLLRAVARVRLDVQPEQVADERRDELVGRDRSEAADRMAAQAEGAGRRRSSGVALEGERVPDPEGRVALLGRRVVVGQPVEDGRQVAGARRRASPGPRDTERTRGISSPSAGVVVERGLDLARQRVVVRRPVRPSARSTATARALPIAARSASAGNGRKLVTATSRRGGRARGGDRRPPSPCRPSCPSRPRSPRRPRSGTAARRRSGGRSGAPTRSNAASSSPGSRS